MIDVIKLSAEIERLVDNNNDVERIAGGLAFTEGPVWDVRNGRLLFSDIPANTVYEWTSSKGHAVFRRPSGNANGNTFDQEGRLVSCEHSGRRVSRLTPEGTFETIAASFNNKLLNSPNDVIMNSKGDVLFTDPPYGLRRPDGSFAEGELGFNGVFRVNSHGETALLADDFVRPNGLVLNAGETKLFVNDTEKHHVRIFDLAADGALKNGRVFAELKHKEIVGRPDGMKMDVEGNLYVAGSTLEGIWVFNPEGSLLGMIGVGEEPSNLAWGGNEWRTLFVTARTSVYRLPMRVAGMPGGLSEIAGRSGLITPRNQCLIPLKHIRGSKVWRIRC